MGVCAFAAIAGAADGRSSRKAAALAGKYAAISAATDTYSLLTKNLANTAVVEVAVATKSMKTRKSWAPVDGVQPFVSTLGGSR